MPDEVRQQREIPSAPRMPAVSQPPPQISKRQAILQAAKIVLSEFTRIDETAIDPQASEEVQKYLRRSGQNADIQFYRDRNGHFAGLKFHVGPAQLKAIGNAPSKKGARTLCFMHARLLLDRVSSETLGEGEELPKPFRLGSREEQRTETRAPTWRPRLPKDPRNLAAWSLYVSQAERYIAAEVAAEKSMAFRRYAIPPTGNPLVDEASEATQLAVMNYSAISRLNAAFTASGHVLPTDWAITAVAPGARLCVVPLPQLGNVLSQGVGRNNQDAKTRCAMHALHMLTVTECAWGITSKERRRFDTRHRHMEPINDVIRTRHSDEAKARLIELYTICLNLPVPVISAEFERDTGLYTCHVEVGDYCFSGRGVNKAEGERNAYGALYEELARNDDTFRDIIQLLETHPHLDPEHIVKLQLSDELSSEIEDLVAGIGVDQEEDADKMQLVDMSAQKLLRKLGQSRCSAEEMHKRMVRLHDDPAYLTKFAPAQARLAMTNSRGELLELIESNRVVVVCGTTGCGKTTQVPQYLLEHEIAKGRGSECTILITQPRRISAISIAHRIAAERLETVGDSIGYTIRLESKPGSHINLCTTGVLLQVLLGRPNLDDVQYLIIDEIHERDINCDFALTAVKDVLQRNKQLKVLLMSATLQSELFSSYFGGAPVLTIDGQLFPIAEYHLDAIAAIAAKKRVASFMTTPPKELVGKSRKFATVPSPKNFDYNLLAMLVAHVVEAHHLRGKSVLVFLPGWKEIIAAKKALETDSRYHFILLHSSVDSAQQMRCFLPAPEGMFKVILSTNIAESGVTIDDVAVVIDTGTIKEMSWVLRSGTTAVGKDATHGLNQLVTMYAARANCIQRRGRAGRTQGGTCYRFYTKEHFDSLPAFQTPEIVRQPLDSVILRILAMGYPDPRNMLANSIEPPPEKMIAASMDHLKALGAIDGETKLTSLGRWLSKLPTPPRVGKMIMLGTILRCLDSVLTLAAASEVDPFVASRELRNEVRDRRVDLCEGSNSDHIANINAFNGFSAMSGSYDYCRMNYLNFAALNTLSRYKRQFFDILASAQFLNRARIIDTQLRRGVRDSRDNRIPFVDVSEYSVDAKDVGLVKAALCAGLFPNVALQNTHRQGTKEKVLRTKLHNHLVIGKNSVAYRTRKDVSASPYYVFDDVMLIADSNTEFLSGVTNANMWAILLLGASYNHVHYRDDLQLGVVDDWIMFWSSPDTVEKILKLKKLLHGCIGVKFERPDDEANNARLDRIQAICKQLVNMPMKPNEFSTAEWKLSGKIISPFPPSVSDSASNVEHMDTLLDQCITVKDDDQLDNGFTEE